MKKSGFTLIEMLITMAILALLLAIVPPNFKQFISHGNMVANANGMIGAFKYARMEAVKRGTTVHIEPVGDDWTGGIVVWVDSDEDGSRDVGEEVRLWPDFDSTVTVSSTNDHSIFSFAPTGSVNNDDQVTLCDDRTGERGVRISVLLSGAVIAEKVTCA